MELREPAEPAEVRDRSFESIWSHLKTVAFRQDWVDAGGVRTRFAQAGPADAPPLIMLHGTGGTWEAYCATLASHSKHFNCLAIDFMGSGYSDKPLYDYQIADYVGQVLDVSRAFGLERFSLMGISLGSWVATRFASTHPDLVRSLTLIAPFGYADDEEEIGNIVKRRSNAYDDPSWDNIRTIFANLMYAEEKRLDDLIALRRETYRLPGAKAASAHVLAALRPENLARSLITDEECARIAAPTFVVESKKDRPLFVQSARRLVEVIPGAELFQMDDVGHWPQFEDPATFDAAHIPFLLTSWGRTT